MDLAMFFYQKITISYFETDIGQTLINVYQNMLIFNIIHSSLFIFFLSFFIFAFSENLYTASKQHIDMDIDDIQE